MVQQVGTLYWQIINDVLEKISTEYPLYPYRIALRDRLLREKLISHVIEQIPPSSFSQSRFQQIEPLIRQSIRDFVQ
ncbi:hypothetical protein [Phormidium sp. CCY1219]|jgi:hypothetical protein|uniref:hypothetical protein n=1 Tax=Phormidium sp. CCY1219 TaxID=2886104 RepID=UPI002D1EAA85|nr:hypothetical protein [Phormidium sp. CCY1219]MEB3826498.1 hypothetical protein [Phormidium sp. CCY1219]